jgi:hypothetical protein
MNLVIAFSYCRCVTNVLYAHTVRAAWYGSFCALTVQTVPTMLTVGASLPYRIRARAALYSLRPILLLKNKDE